MGTTVLRRIKYRKAQLKRSQLQSPGRDEIFLRCCSDDVVKMISQQAGSDIFCEIIFIDVQTLVSPYQEV
jgi:tRNA A37 threonylcarbamoyladenosine synthetase subunit TsaC/SUA5/YrdC